MRKTNNQVDLDRLKKDVSILKVLESCGVYAKRQADGTRFMALCPFHEDKNPSLSVDPVKNVWHCFGCRKGGSVIDFVMEHEKISFRDAVDRLLVDHSNGAIYRCGKPSEASAKNRQKLTKQEEPSPETAAVDPALIRKVFEYYQKTLGGKDTKGIKYLKSRHLADKETLETFQIGYCDGTLKEILPTTAIPPLKKAGLLRKDGSEFFSGCIVTPIFREDGALGEVYGRRIENAESGKLKAETNNQKSGSDSRPLTTDHRPLTTGAKHLYLPGPHRGVMNAKAAQVYADDEIIITEAIFDALTFYAHGIKNVIPCYGTGGFLGFQKGTQSAEALREGGTDSDTHLGLLLKYGVRKTVIAFDGDKAGDTAANDLAEKLTEEGIDCHRLHVPGVDLAENGKAKAGTVKDINEYVSELYRQGMPKNEVGDCLEKLASKSRRFGHRRQTKTSGRLKLTEQTDTDLIFTSGDLTYRLRGLSDNNATSLRVVMTVSRQSPRTKSPEPRTKLPAPSSPLPASPTHTDRFDLYTSKSRASFTYRAANRLEILPVKIEEDLNQLIPLLEILRKEADDRTEEPKKAPELTPSETRKAIAFLKSPNLLEKIAADLETVGYVGESRNKQLAYLIATSRKLQKPLSAIVRSESGAGKSFLMECVAELTPPEEVQYFSRLTPQSLYYMGKDELVHKLLIVDERDGSEESEYPIRTLQTRRKLTLAVPMKDPSTGKIKTKMLEINGPIAYMESSTQQSINPENLNRCFELYLDDTEKQTTLIMARQREARTLSGLVRDDRREKIIHLHHNAQRVLRSLKVIVPYANEINFPAQWIRTRRDHDRFLSLLEIIAFLHQHQREIKRTGDGTEYIEATPEDYAATYALGQSVFAESMHELGKPAKGLLDAIRSMVAHDIKQLDIAQKDHWFTRRDIREFSKLPDYVIKRSIRQLEDLEYLDVRRSSQGSSHRYRLPSRSDIPAMFAGLTTPEELQKKWNTGTKVGQPPKTNKNPENKG